jgi:hypothetical protein
VHAGSPGSLRKHEPGFLTSVESELKLNRRTVVLFEHHDARTGELGNVENIQAALYELSNNGMPHGRGYTEGPQVRSL